MLRPNKNISFASIRSTSYGTGSWPTLPRDIRENLFCFLDTTSQLNVVTVSKAWYIGFREFLYGEIDVDGRKVSQIAARVSCDEDLRHAIRRLAVFCCCPGSTSTEQYRPDIATFPPLRALVTKIGDARYREMTWATALARGDRVAWLGATLLLCGETPTLLIPSDAFSPGLADILAAAVTKSMSLPLVTRCFLNTRCLSFNRVPGFAIEILLTLPQLRTLRLSDVHDSDDGTPWLATKHNIEIGSSTLQSLYFRRECCAARTAARLINLSPNLKEFIYEHTERTFGGKKVTFLPSVLREPLLRLKGSLHKLSLNPTGRGRPDEGIDVTFGSLGQFSRLEEVFFRVEYLLDMNSPSGTLSNCLPMHIRHLHLAGCRKAHIDTVIQEVENMVRGVMFFDLREITVTISIVQRRDGEVLSTPRFAEVESLCAEYGVKFKVGLGPSPHDLDEEGEE
ncbi:hypothetical protein BJX68DRAFT_214183 [Aspergillus pseudodeflectus]|uniref:Leucine-rich repeat domain-containing protein n=1 Tax=Aspergillus pseudodeflectus TaxID=176178 RepID=A0ABR4JE27_9EURO